MFIVWILVELVIELFAAIVLEILLTLIHALDEDEGARVPSAFFLAVIGIVFGALSIVLAPTRLLPSRFFPGLSLFVTPVVVGLTMEAWGRDKARRNKSVSHLATWYGGAALGLGLATGRLVALAFLADVEAL